MDTLEVKLLIAFLNEDDDEAERLVSMMTENELITLRSTLNRIGKFITLTMIERDEKQRFP